MHIDLDATARWGIRGVFAGVCFGLGLYAGSCQHEAVTVQPPTLGECLDQANVRASSMKDDSVTMRAAYRGALLTKAIGGGQ